MLRGSYVAIVTPFKNGKVDGDSLKKLVDFHIKNGTEGIVPCGTTGESATLTHEEHVDVIRMVVEYAGKKVKVVAGTGSNSTSETISLTRNAEGLGVDAALLIVPYYNKPTQRGLYEHFSKVAGSVKIPLVLYNIPGRTAVNMLPETLISLAKKHKNIIGLKEASASMDYVSRIHDELGESFDIISGDDSLTLPMMALGGKGVISVIANLVPKDVSDMCVYMAKGDLSSARKIHYKMFDLIKALFIETNPIPVKAALEMMGMCSSELRLPLCRIGDENKAKLTGVMKEYGLIK